jgi:predicted nucleotide-binding protein
MIPRSAHLRIFGGSSLEGLDAIREVQRLLEFDADMEIWTGDVFQPSDRTLESLIEQTTSVDFAIFVLTADDEVRMRGQTYPIARDNVIFELGLFYGAIGKNRVYMLVPRDQAPRLPTDLLRITPVTYDHTKANWASRLGAACTTIRQRLRALRHFDRLVPSQIEGLVPEMPTSNTPGDTK